MKIQVVRPMPRMTLSAKVPVTDEFRAEINAWMGGFFGYTSILSSPNEIIQYTDPHTGNKTIFCSQETYDKLKVAT